MDLNPSFALQNLCSGTMDKKLAQTFAYTQKFRGLQNCLLRVVHQNIDY
ncbi:hypothetical protein [Candidatus Williamhamiltonella defendens]|nr:hypothetical protein [Candidatus Hamiltonella defensa]